MPGVDVYYKHGFMEESVADALRTAVAEFGQTEFSTSDWQLGLNDFSFKFHRPEKYDRLTHDLIVRIRLDAFDERVERISDQMAENLAWSIRNAVSALFKPARVLDVGVELMLASISWGAATRPTPRAD